MSKEPGVPLQMTQTDRYLRFCSYAFTAAPAVGALIFAANHGAFAYAFLAIIAGASIGFVGGIDFMHAQHPVKDQTGLSK